MRIFVLILFAFFLIIDEPELDVVYALEAIVADATLPAALKEPEEGASYQF